MYFVRRTDSICEWQEEAIQSSWSRMIQHDMPVFGKSPIHIIDAREKKQVCLMSPISTHYPIPMLKSNIQKTFRRNLIEKCISTSQQLLRQEPMELLRRLPVIFLEDAQYHQESYSLVVWLMAAHSKGYQLTIVDEQLILSALVTSMSSSYRYDTHTDTNGDITSDGLSIAFRALFGGMKGDVAFLMRLAKRAHELEQVDSWLIVPPFPDFSMEQMIPQAIDFHCCGTIVAWCSERVHMAQDAIQRAIWWHWSSPNQRDIIENREEAMRQEEARSQTKDDYERLIKSLEWYASTKLKWMLSQKKKVMIQKTLSFQKKFF
jgi:hypothetical protein